MCVGVYVLQSVWVSRHLDSFGKKLDWGDSQTNDKRHRNIYFAVRKYDSVHTVGKSTNQRIKPEQHNVET